MFLSIIIPVYNVDVFLPECLDSCLNQNISNDDYEIICIDDGSTDRSGTVLDEYGRNNNNIIVVHKENEGLSSARNVGISFAKGDYLWFVDSDDFIQENVLQMLKTVIQNNSLDLLTANAYAFGDYSDYPVLSKDEMENKHHLKGIRTSKYDSLIVMNLYKRQLINDNHLRFEKAFLSCEDTPFHFYFDAISKVKMEIDDVIYFYRRRPCSLMSTDFYARKESQISYCVFFKDYYDKDFGDSYYSARLLSKALKSLLYSISRMPRKEMKENTRLLKQRGLYPLKKNYFHKKYDIWNVEKRKPTGIYSKWFNKMYNRIYTPLGFWFVRFDKKICNFRGIVKH